MSFPQVFAMPFAHVVAAVVIVVLRVCHGAPDCKAQSQRHRCAEHHPFNPSGFRFHRFFLLRTIPRIDFFF